MKRLILWLALLLPFFANAQTNGTIQKTSATGTIRGSFGSLGLDTLTRVTGALVNGYILKYHAATNKWYASPDGYISGLQDSLTKKANRTFDNVASGAIAKSKVDTTATGLQTVSNFFPKGDTRYLKGTGSGVTSVTGTTNQIAVTGTTAPVLSIPSTFIAPGSIKAVTTLATGTTGTSGSVSFMRSSDGFTGSVIDQFGGNTLRLTSSGGTKQIDLISDATNISGVIKFPTSSATLATGDMGYNSTYGQYLRGKTGSTDDWTIFAAGGGYVMHNPTGTNGVAYASLAGSGDVIVGADNNGLTGKIAIGSGLSLASGTLTATGGSAGTINGSGTSGMITKFTGSGTVGNSIMTEAGSVITVAGSTNVTSSVNGVSGGFSNADATNGYGVKILSEGSASGRYALTLKNIAETQTYLHVSTETASKGSVVVGSVTPWTGLSSHGFTVNGTSYGSIGLNINDVNKGYLTGYADGLILQPVGKLVLANNTGNVLIGTTTDDGVNKFQVTGNTAITGNVTAANLASASGYTATSANTVLTVPLRDSNGDFSAGVITASLAGNASTATALQTARNIQGVSFNGTADINPINGTGFVKASGTTLSYDNSTYLTTSSAASTYAPLSSPTFTGTPAFPTGTTGVTQTAGDNSTKLATTAYVDAALGIVEVGFISLSGDGTTTSFDTGIVSKSSLAPGDFIMQLTPQTALSTYYIASASVGGGNERWFVTFATAPASASGNIKFTYSLKYKEP